MSFSYHDKNQTGQLMIRATDDVEKVRLFIGQGLLQLVGAVILLVGHGHHSVLVERRAGVDGHADPADRDGAVRCLCQPRPADVHAKCSKNFPHLNTVLQENLAGIKVIKAFTREKEQQAKFRTAADDTMEQSIAVARLFTFLFPLVFLIANLGQAAILYVGGKQIIIGTADARRVAGILALPDVPVLPHHDVRHDRHADGTGRRIR